MLATLRGHRLLGALGGRCLRMADYVRRLAARRAPPPQRANVGYALWHRLLGALGGRCLRMADYVRRLAATRAPPPQRANVGYALSPTRRPTRVTEREEPLTEEVA